MFFVDDPADASSQQREECQCGLLLTVAVPAKQVCSPVGDRSDQIMNDVLSAIRDGRSGSFVLSLTTALDTLSYHLIPRIRRL